MANRSTYDATYPTFIALLLISLGRPIPRRCVSVRLGKHWHWDVYRFIGGWRGMVRYRDLLSKK